MNVLGLHAGPPGGATEKAEVAKWTWFRVAHRGMCGGSLRDDVEQFIQFSGADIFLPAVTVCPKIPHPPFLVLFPQDPESDIDAEQFGPGPGELVRICSKPPGNYCQEAP